MMILQRKVGQVILIGDDIRIMVCDIDRTTNRVKIGVEAPREILVDREEVREARMSENQDQETP